MAELIQKLHVEDRGLLVARLHYLSPHLLNILADFATIAAPTTNWLVVFQVEINVAEQANLSF